MKKVWKLFGFWTGTALIWELCLHLTVYGGLERFLPGLVLTVGLGALLALLCSLPHRIGTVCSWVVPIVLVLIYGTQVVYFDIFGSLLSLSFVAGGGDAIGEFYLIALRAILHKLPQLLILLAPLVTFYVLRHKGLLDRELPWKQLGLLAAVVVLVPAVTFPALPLGGTGVTSHKTVLHNPNATIDRWAEHFGLVTGGVLDAVYLGADNPTAQLNPGVDLSGTPDLPEAERNVLPEMDFETLQTLTEDPRLQQLNAYFASLSGTEKNEYTGLFEGYNLIVLCGEAFCGYCIDPELTPTLYRMSTEGIVFENFYNSFPNLTTNGEYSLCMGLMPDLSRMSFATSKDHYLPFTLGNIWRERGLSPMAYHGNVGTFYNRVNTHPNMGYTFKALDCGLELERTQPTSDLEMMEKSLPDYVEQEPFHAYYMTYSGHAEYGVDKNDMSKKNWDAVKDLDTTEGVKGYLASQLELEYAMKYLLEELETRGLADHTVVVLTGDHLPYGMADEDYAVMAGEEATKEPFWRFRNSFICWTGGLEEPIVVDDYCCTQDILPTLLNLFGLPYDSRLLTGRDILSNCTHMALLKDGSFLTEQVLYDSSTGKLTWKGEPDEALGEQLMQAASDQFTVSAAILSTDYYGFAFPALGLSEGRRETETVSSYADTAGTWYEAQVELLTTYGALSGGATGAFNGEKPASRADFTAMVARALGLPRGEEAPPYGDLEPGTWYYDPVSAGYAAGLLPEGETFRPTEPITVEEAREILQKAFPGDVQAECPDESQPPEAESPDENQDPPEAECPEAVRSTLEEAIRLQTEAGSEAGENGLSRGAAVWIVAELLPE